MLYLANRVLSAAMSASMIRPLAASRLLSCRAISSPAKRNLDMEAPVVRTQGGNVLHRLSEDAHGDVRQIDRLVASSAMKVITPALESPRLRMVSLRVSENLTAGL